MTQGARAAVLVEPGRFEVQEIPLPEPGPGQVRLRMEGCGVCASNIPPYEGRDWFDYPFEPGQPGHEGWGVVDALGEGVEGLEEGQRVAALTYKAYASHDLAEASAVVPLPGELEGKPFPGEPLSCAMNIFGRGHIEAGQTVAIIGVGFLGALLVGLAKDAGARVLAISRRPFSLEVARAFGADECIPMEDHWQIIEQVKGLTDEAMCERVFECAGKQWPLDLAGELTGIRGRLMIAGYHQDGPRQVNMQLWNWRGLDVINTHERDPARYVQGMRDAIDAVHTGRLDPSPLFTHRFGLDELGDALDAARNREEGFMKALIEL